MTETPLLTAVTFALRSRLPAMDHFVHLINHFLIPTTIDAAVYLDLQLVTKVFGACRPLTFGAMDGAAARGRLDIVKRIHANRSEGCSAAAFNGAAASNNLDVLGWLLESYSGCCNITEAVAYAAGAGHLRVVKFLRASEYVRFTLLDYIAALEAAVLNEQVEVLGCMLNEESISFYQQLGGASAVNTAAKNGLTKVMQVLVGIIPWSDKYMYCRSPGLESAAAAGHIDIVTLLLKHGRFSQTYLEISVEKAAKGGHMRIVFMLLPSCGEGRVGRALAAAVVNNRNTLAEFLVRFCSSSQVESVAKSVGIDQCELLKLLLTKHTCLDCFEDPVDESAYISFASAAACGNEQVVEENMHQFTSTPAVHIGSIVEVAAATSQCETVKMILDYFTLSIGFPEDFGVRPALKRALEVSDNEMVRLLTTYCDKYMVGAVLMKFVVENKVQALNVLTERSYQYVKAACAVKEYLADRIGIFTTLMEFIQISTTGKVSVTLSETGRLEFVNQGSVKQQKLDTLFTQAVMNGTTELVEFLLGEMSGGVIGLSLLTAARLGHIELVKLLLGKSEPWEIQFYALEEAAKARKVKVVDYLRKWCGPTRMARIIADMRKTGDEEAAVQLANLPLLTAVAVALPLKIQDIDHILYLVNHFLMPSTIDAAVYLDLRQVTKVFGSCRPWTVGVMDGAASRGRLDIIIQLHNNRSEGCSAAAFNGAAANNHCEVLRFLHMWYVDSCNFTEALTSAVGAGHLQAVVYLILSVATRHGNPRPNYDIVFDAVVLNGRVTILEFLLRTNDVRIMMRRGTYRRLVTTAAKNGLTDVLRVLLCAERTPNVNVPEVLEYAAATGNVDIVSLLLEHTCSWK
ncbi:hypothetical protein P3T76_004867 [Phytophthora citrophthora]|uniref:Ankyrin repeat protein n=1 Tax=Phytophthora citrophthora TaxID=4793 RepID=A0AAD9GSP2_9STRA|nr:hypothetical protein P3T76_004867 [Phytophthora citrophthora]